MNSGVNAVSHTNIPCKLVKLAVNVTKDLSELQKMRRSLRGRFLTCAWCDQVAVTRKLEAALRGMWRNHVANITSDAMP